MKRTSRIIALLFLVALFVAGSSMAGAAGGNAYIIRGGRVVTVSGGVIEGGSVVIQNGKITAVGKSVSVPSGALVINTSGLSVYPGMIDPLTSLGLVEVGAVSATVDTTELGDFNPQVKASVAVNAHSELIPVTRVNGITTVVTAPRGGVFSGQAALINLNGWTIEDMVVKAPVAMIFNFPRLSPGFGFGGFFAQAQTRSFNELKTERDKKLDQIRKVLDQARDYGNARDAEAKNAALPKREDNIMLGALVHVVRGEWPVIIPVDEERDIKAAIDFVKEYKLKAIFSGVKEGFKVASLLKENNIPVIVTDVLALPTSEDAPYDEPFTNAAALYKAGVKMCFATGEAAHVRDLPYHAAMAAAFGLPKDEAFKAVTLNTAEILGVGDQLGSLDKGKIANVIVTDGDPLEIRTQVKYLFIAGQEVPVTSKHNQLYEKFIARP